MHCEEDDRLTLSSRHFSLSSTVDDPDAITTRDGNLVITMTQQPWRDLNFRSGMLQSWNKFWCVITRLGFHAHILSVLGTQLHGRLPGSARIAARCADRAGLLAWVSPASSRLVGSL